MAKKKQEVGIKKSAPRPEDRENQMVALAMDLAEQQLRDGTASPSIIAHFLKVGSSNNAVETTLKKSQAVLAESKAQSIKQAELNKNTAEAAIEAMKRYKVE